MKKILLGLMIVALGMGVSAKKWTNNVGVGLGVPVSFVGVEDADDDITQIGIGFLDLTYIGVHENGFTAKADITAGLAIPDGVTFWRGTDADLGIFYEFTLGAGYAFVRTEKLTVAATGTLGVEAAVYTDTYEKGSSDMTDGFGFAMLSVGADVTALYRLKEHFGLYANVSVRYPIWGRAVAVQMNRYDSGDIDHTDIASTDGNLFGMFLVQPSLGVVWNF